MAKYQKKKIQDTENSGFGQYQEGVGGGASPKALDPNQRAPGVNSEHRKDHNDTMQPRTNDGKFTYKSVNGESIDPKYGPSRGKTVNPLLTGGKNGVMIDDVKDQEGNTVKEGVSTQFKNQSGEYWEQYKDKWYQKGGEAALPTQGAHHKPTFTTRIAADTIWNIAKRRYDTVKGEFEQESSVFDEAKKGRSTQDEKAAKQKAQATGEEQYVIDQNTASIAIKPGTIQPLSHPTTIGSKPSPAQYQKPSPVAPAQHGQQPQVQAQAQASPEPASAPEAKPLPEKFGSGKYSPEQGIAVRNYLKEELGPNYNPMFDDDEVLEQFIDSQGGEAIFASLNEETPAEEPAKSEESEAEKKIKKMGFSD